MIASRFTEPGLSSGGSCLDPGSRSRRRRGIERPARARGRIETVDETEAQPLHPGPGDHRRVVGAQRRGRRHEVELGRMGEGGEAIAQPDVGGDAAGDDQASALRLVPAKPGDGVGGAVAQRIADRQLDRRRQIRPVARIERVACRGRCGAPRFSARKTKNRSRACRRADAAGQSAAHRRPGPRARSPARPDSRARSALRSCRRLRRPRRRGWCRDGCSGRPRRRRAAGSARPRRAAADRETRHHRSAARSAHGLRDG